MSHIEKLLEQMIDHRKRVVMQVSGVPQRALLAVGYGSAPSHPDISEDPIKPAGWIAWMEERARHSTLLGVLYENMTPWGREKKRIESEQMRMAQEKSRKLNEAEILERDLIIDAVAWTDQDKEVLDRIDTGLINSLVNKGYFDQVPNIINRSIDLFGGSPSAIVPMEAQGIVRMNSDRMGDYFSAFPEGTQGKALLAKQWSRGEVPDRQEHVYSVYMRWFILLHETTHCLYGKPSSPFDPTPGVLDEETVGLVNRWIVGGLGTAGAAARELLDENHSDVYAVMLLLEQTDHDPVARKVVNDILEVRRKGQQEADRELIEQKDWPEKGGIVDTHCTCWALERAMENVDQWRGASPERLREMARRYASDGFVDLVDPKRTLMGENVGKLTLERVVPGSLKQKDLTKLIVMMAYSYSLNGHPERWLEKQDKTHPLHAMVRQSWEEFFPKLRQLLAQDLKEDRYPGLTVADAVRRNLHEGIEKVVDLIKNSPLPINDTNSQAYQFVETQSRKTGKDLIQRIERQLGGMEARSGTKISPGEFSPQTGIDKKPTWGCRMNL